ncbi:MarR family transcriptional regulator [Colwellia sp. MT41]|uniref:TIGR01777 family oxidoreductase n=1 Tax=Colwellia sp. MT41 TaxID=58049 RepID=UPI0007179411|nr:TIGR01777 family oxidoreductase [Colwellia sp. MT41]ALO36177.1 MarR family transcriptional regulator [Colwellia sp. MT41]
MKILITGGTGLIGRHFIKSFQQPYQFTVLTRNSEKAKQGLPQGVEFIEQLPEQNCFEVIINLAGEPIIDKRWTVKQKEKICQSRWQITEQIIAMIERARVKPTCLISGSAIGYYGETGNVSTHEDAQVSQADFAHSLCEKWENIALKAREHCRVVLLRTGVILASDGGALAKMRLPFTLGLGGKLGHGQQYMSWIHIDDMVHIIHFSLQTTSIEGAINCTSPKPLTNAAFTKALGQQFNRPTWFSVPAFMLKSLMGQGAELLLTSQNIYPQKLLNHGFDFNHSNLEHALADLL